MRMRLCPRVPQIFGYYFFGEKIYETYDQTSPQCCDNMTFGWNYHDIKCVPSLPVIP